MVKKFEDFSNERINEQSSWLDNPAYHQYLKDFKVDMDKHILELDKIYARLTSESLTDVLKEDLSSLDKYVSEIETKMRISYDDIIAQIEQIDEEEFNSKWDGVEMLADEFHRKGYDKYNVLDSLIMELQDIQSLDLKPFDSNSAIINIETEEEN